MINRPGVWISLVGLALLGRIASADELLTLRGKQVELHWAPAGGALVAFRFLNEETNPLNFEITPALESPRDNEPVLRGHFLCLDRWGAPSAAEVAKGVPFHGEAPRVHWTISHPPEKATGSVSAEMAVALPLAGFRVIRRIVLDEAGSVAIVTERVTNTNKLGRIYNMVQHPTIAPPFLNDGTIVDSNALQGFVQDQPIPASREVADRWPHVRIGDDVIDLRALRKSTATGAQHDVSSFVFAKDENFGWVTACSPQHNLLLGYLWKTADYPWLNIWRYRQEGKAAARGLEFGTTGYHQPFSVLVRQGRILDLPLADVLDPDETRARSYLCFLAKIPADFQGVGELQLRGEVLRLKERRATAPRTIELPMRLSLGDR